MLTALSRSHKLIAWFFAILLYFDLILLPTGVKAGIPLRPAPAINLTTSASLLGQPGIASPLPVRDNHSISASPRAQNSNFTTGPTQPETQSYQSVNANNMVDLFTGDFSY